ncbi:MAG: hypothetical protein AB8G05_20640 [Oligoflexales bacterium]
MNLTRFFSILLLFFSLKSFATPIKVNLIGVDEKTTVWSGRAIIAFVEAISKSDSDIQVRSHFIPSPKKASLSDSERFLKNDPDYIIFVDDFHYHFFGSSIANKTNAKIGVGSLYAPPAVFNKFDPSKQFGVIQAPSYRNLELIKKYSKTTKFLMVGGPLAQNMGVRLKELAVQAGFNSTEIFLTEKWQDFRDKINSTDRDTLTLILAPFEVYKNGKNVTDLEFASSINSCPSPSVTIKDIPHADPLFTLTGNPESLGESLGKSLLKFINEGKSPGIIDSVSAGLSISRSKAKTYIKEFNSPEVVGFFRHH